MTTEAYPKPDARARSAIAFSIVAFVGVMAALFWARADYDVLVYLLPAMPAFAVMGWVVFSACRGRAWAIGTYLAFLVFLANANFRTREIGDIALDWQNGLKFLSWCAALLIGICCVAGARRPHWSMNYWLFLIYTLYALASTIYSVEPLYTFASAVGTLGLFLFAIAAAQVLDMRRMALITLCALTIFLLASWIVDFTAPEFSRVTSWSIHGPVERMGGIASDPNQLARAAAVFVVFVVILYRHRQLKWAPCFAALLLTAATMWATQKSNQRGGRPSGTRLRDRPPLGPAIRSRRPAPDDRRRHHLVAAGQDTHRAVVVVLAVRRLRGATDLTGRVDLWKFVWQKSMEAPLIGHGFNASEYFLSRTYSYFPLDWDPQDAHNMLLQTLLTLGFFGVALLGLFIWRLADLYLNAPAPYRDAMLGLVLMVGVTGSGAFGITPNLLTLMMLLTMAAANSAGSRSGDGGTTPPVPSPEPLARGSGAAARKSDRPVPCAY